MQMQQRANLKNVMWIKNTKTQKNMYHIIPFIQKS